MPTALIRCRPASGESLTLSTPRNGKVGWFSAIRVADRNAQTAPTSAIHRMASELPLSMHSGRSCWGSLRGVARQRFYASNVVIIVVTLTTRAATRLWLLLNLPRLAFRQPHRLGEFRHHFRLGTGREAS